MTTTQRRPFMVRTLRSHEVTVTLAMAFMAASASVFAVLTSRWLGPADRGVVVVTATTGSLLMLLGSVGVSNGGRVLLARTPPLPLRRYISVARNLATVHIVTAVIAGLSILWLTKTMDDPVTAMIFVPYAVLVLLSYLYRECLHGLGKHVTAVTGDICTSAVQTVVVLGAFLLGGLSLRVALTSMLLGQAAQVAVLWFFLRKERRSQTENLADLSNPAVIRFSLSAVPVIFGQAFVIRGDRLILGVMATPASVGVYGAAASFTELLWLIAGGVGQVAFRRSTRTSSGSASARPRVYALALTGVGCAAMAAAAPMIVPALLGQEFREAVPLVGVLSVAALPMASYQIDVAILNGLGAAKKAGVTTGVGSLTLAVLCVVFIPFWGAMGAAFASITAYAVMAVLARSHVRRFS